MCIGIYFVVFLFQSLGTDDFPPKYYICISFGVFYSAVSILIYEYIVSNGRITGELVRIGKEATVALTMGFCLVSLKRIMKILRQ